MSGGLRIVQTTAFSDILAREVLGRMRSLHDVAMSVHVDTVKVSFLVSQSCTLADSRDATTKA